MKSNDATAFWSYGWTWATDGSGNFLATRTFACLPPASSVGQGAKDFIIAALTALVGWLAARAFPLPLH